VRQETWSLQQSPAQFVFGGEATSRAFHCSFAPTRLLLQSNAFSVQNFILIENIKEVQNDWFLMSTENGSTRLWKTRSFVLLSTSVHLAAGTPLVISAIPAHCVVDFYMSLTNAVPDDSFSIVTTLKPEAWNCALKDAGILKKFQNIPVGLQECFYCGSETFHCHAHPFHQTTTCQKKIKNS
jgi:hypothetical protein